MTRLSNLVDQLDQASSNWNHDDPATSEGHDYSYRADELQTIAAAAADFHGELVLEPDEPEVWVTTPCPSICSHPDWVRAQESSAVPAY